jgi:hypothetical protein
MTIFIICILSILLIIFFIKYKRERNENCDYHSMLHQEMRKTKHLTDLCDSRFEMIKEQSELMNHYYESYDRLYKTYKASCSDSKDCK